MAQKSPAVASIQRAGQPQVFEFTKRKKWSDILLSELPDTVLLILNPAGVIQYAGAGVSEMLGFEVEEVVNKDVLTFINDDDGDSFRERFQASLGTQQELCCYARLKCKNSPAESEQYTTQKELLFEVKGHPLYIPDDSDCKCFFFMAKPYPSRNMAILNTFLELKIENERLTQRLTDLKVQHEAKHPRSLSSSLNMASSMPHSQFMHSSYTLSPADDMFPTPSMKSGFEPDGGGFVHSTVTNTREEDEDEGGKKKKLKRNHVGESQYVCVTCGRTDSPEWRKGPKGPKTLCNACGLRWAKRSRKTDDVPLPGQSQSQGAGMHDRGGRDPAVLAPSGSGSSAGSTSASSSNSGRAANGPVPNAALSVTPASASTQPGEHTQVSSGARTSPTHAALERPAHGLSHPQPRSAGGTFMPSGRYSPTHGHAHSSHSPQSSGHPSQPHVPHHQPHQPPPSGYGYQPGHDQYHSPYDQYPQWSQQHTYPGY